MMALEDYVRNSVISDENSNTVPDSTLSGYMIGKLSSDSLKISQAIFLHNYLNCDKEISADRFRIVADIPDTIIYEEPIPCLRIYFIAGAGK